MQQHDPYCTVMMDANRSVTASFGVEQSYVLTVSLGGDGLGNVSSGSAIACPGDCTESFPAGTQVELTANPSVGSTFEGWSGDCTGTAAL